MIRCADGMSLFEPGTRPVNIPVASKSVVFDVTGAGDTGVAAFTFARHVGAGYLEAACLGKVAGGLSVRRSGAAPVGAVELRAALDG